MVYEAQLQQLAHDYSLESPTGKIFEGIEPAVSNTLGKMANTICTLDSSAEVAGKTLTPFIELATVIQRNLLLTAHQQPQQRYLVTTAVARAAGTLDPQSPALVGTTGEKGKNYFVLARVREPAQKRSSLMILLQRVPNGISTGAEVHGISKTGDGHYRSNGLGGIELFLPLTDGIEYTVNGTVYTPKALTALIVALPGDIHSLRKVSGKGPARTLIIAGAGFTRGTKVDENVSRINVSFFFDTLPLARFNAIPRCYSLNT